MKSKFYLYDLKIPGLPERKATEGADYRFHRSRLERCFPDIKSSYYAELLISAEAAIALLENKKSAKKTTLSVGELETIRRALQEYKNINEKYSEAASSTQGLLAVLDEAGKIYREGQRSAAAKKIGWTHGKRQRVIPHANIFGTYMFLISPPDPQSKSEAIKILKQQFSLHSEVAVIQSLARTFKTLKKTWPDLAGILPNNWPKI